jgi:spermidine/putrescine transport system permease protein
MSAIAHIGQDVAAPPPSRRGKKWVPYLLLLPGMLWLVVFFVVPMLTLLSQSLQTGSIDTGYTLTWHWQTYTDAFSLYWPQFLRSFIYAFVATAMALLIGYPLAYTIAFKSGKWKGVLLVLVIAPFFTSFLLRTLAWQTILSSNGIVVKVFNATGLMNVLQALNLVNGDQLLSTPFAVMAGLTYNFLPFMVLPLYVALEKIDPRLIDAARDLYSDTWRAFRKVVFPLSLPGVYGRPFTAFRKVTWPLSMPGVVAGTLLTFIPAAGDYINSKLLGNPNTTMIGQVIDGQFLRVLDYPTAAALSFTLMVTILVLVSVYVWRAGTEELV